MWRSQSVFYQLLDGAYVTLALASIVWIVGLGIGGYVTYLALTRLPILKRSLPIVAFIFGSIPVIVPLLWCHYPLQEMLGIVVPPFLTAAAVLSIVNVLIVSTLLLKNFELLPSQYRMAALTLGVPACDIFWKIELPILLRTALPWIVITQMAMLHMTLIASAISVNDLFKVAQRLAIQTFRPVEVFGLVGLFFLVIVLPTNYFAARMHGRFTKELSDA